MGPNAQCLMPMPILWALASGIGKIGKQQQLNEKKQHGAV